MRWANLWRAIRGSVYRDLDVATKSARSWRRAANKGFRAEKRVAKALRARLVGGPGKPDILSKGRVVENKHFDTRTVHEGHVRVAYAHGANVFNASGRKGFSKAARRVARELGIRLTHVKR